MVPTSLAWALALLANVLCALAAQESPLGLASRWAVSQGVTTAVVRPPDLTDLTSPLRKPQLASTPTAIAATSSQPPPLPLSLDGDVCVAITGGAGQIAYALVPLFLHGKVFGEGRKVRLRLLDIEACTQALEGVAMEIRDCYSDLVTEVIATSDPEVAFKGADVAVLLGGFPRLQGMQRRDLVAKNVPIMAEHGAALAKCAKKSVRVLVVANPACTNCLVASAAAPSIPRNQFSSLARLDQDRLSAMVAEEISSKTSTSVHNSGGGSGSNSNIIKTTAATPPTPTPTPPASREQRALPSRVEIRGAYLWGNHSPTMWPDVSKAEAKVNGRWVPVDSALRRRVGIDAAEESLHQDHAAERGLEEMRWREWVSISLVPAVRNRGTEVINIRGKSSAMSAANAIANHLRDWLSSSAAAAGAAAAAVRDEGKHSTGERTQDKQEEEYGEKEREGKEETGEGGGEKEGGEEEERQGREGEKDGKEEEKQEGKAAMAGVAAAVGVGVSMGVFSDGNPYGVPDGLVCSFPVECGEGRHRILEGFCPDRDMLEASTHELLEEREEAFEILRESGLFAPGR